VLAAATGRPPSGLLDLTVSWAALTGARDGPAALGRLGPVTASQALPLAWIAWLDPYAQWRVIVTDAAGHAIAVERIRRRQPRQSRRARGVTGRVTIVVPDTALPDSAVPRRRQPGQSRIRAAVLRTARRAAARAHRAATADAAATGGCAHTAASSGYRPPARVREYVEARDQTCRHSTCRQPAWRADLDHTVPWDQGGRTCSCNIGGRCRTHHKIKQLPGWTLRQPRPGYFELTTPAGRTYVTEPDTYPS